MSNLVEKTIEEVSISLLLETKHKVAFRKFVKEENGNHLYLFRNVDLHKIQILFFDYLENFNLSEQEKAFEFYKIISNSNNDIKCKFPLSEATKGSARKFF